MHTEGRRVREQEGRGCSDTGKSQAAPRTAGHRQKLEEAREDSSLEPSEGV